MVQGMVILPRLSYITRSFGRPCEGHVERDHVFAIPRRPTDAGAAEITFGDTTGMVNPAQDVGECLPQRPTPRQK